MHRKISNNINEFRIMKKLKTVKIPMSDGSEKVVAYRPIEKIPTSHLICDKECPYGKCCSFMPDPRDPGNQELSFTDFCNDLGGSGEEDDALSSMVPKEGTLEEVFKDQPDVLQKIIASRKLVYLDEVIDKCCPDICEYYNKVHSECSLENKMCFLRGLFVGPVKEDKSLEEETQGEKAVDEKK